MSEKTCTKCKTTKPLADFHRMSANRLDGHSVWCKSCSRASDRRRYEANIDRLRDADYQRTYGITLDEFDALLTAQSGRCSICKTTKPGGHGRFHVDHDHETQRVRGLLCSNCNTGLGKFKDEPRLLLAAARYLELQRSEQNEPYTSITDTGN